MMRRASAVLRGGPGDGQTVRVDAWPLDGGGMHPRESIHVAVIDDGVAEPMHEPEQVNRAARVGAPWTVYALRMDDDGAPVVPFEYVAVERDRNEAGLLDPPTDIAPHRPNDDAEEAAP